MTGREAALLTLSAMERRSAWSDGFLKKVIRDEKLDRREAALATRLCFGVLQNRLLLDHYLQQYASMDLGKMESKVRNNLRLGLYQMLFLTRIPPSAAVSEAVELTKKHCKNPRAGGMVNGILRNLARHMEELPALDRRDPLSYLSLLYSHPRWLVELFSQRLGEEETEALLKWDNGEPPVTVQVNTCRYETDAVIAALEEEGVAAERHPWLSGCLILTGTGDLSRLKGFTEGMFYAQDPGARLAVLAADPRPGERVLDICAAPGGKSFAAAQCMENQGEILSCDLYPHKKKLIQAGGRRLGLDSVTACTADGTLERPEWRNAFDRVIADVPCSGLGVLRKKPEIRYKDPALMEGLPALQGEILNNAACYVRPGGVLLYATCTLRKEENEDVVRAFLDGHPAFSLEAFSLPGPMGLVEEGECTLWPQRTGTDGFYMARLRREGGEVAHD